MDVSVQQNFINLLGSSQTFVGVLLTLNVLCIFLDKENNFILNLLNAQNRRLVSKLVKLEKSIISEIRNFQNSEEYKTVNSIASNKSDYQESVSDKAQKLNYKTYVTIFNYQSHVSESYSPIEKIEKYREQVLAPIYSLAFGLVIFVLDEIGRFVKSPDNIFIFTIFVFTIVSITYWITIWGTFINHSSKEHEEGEAPTWWTRLDNKTGVIFGSIVKYIVSGSLCILAIRFLPWHLMNQYGVVIMSVGSFLLPITIIGGLRMWVCNIKGYYSYMHVLGHMVAIAVYAVIIGILFDIVFPLSLDNLDILVNVKWLRLVISCFLLLNGVLLPFLLPYYRCSRIFIGKRNEIQNSYDKIKKKIKDFPDEYNRLCQEIGKEVISKKSKIETKAQVPDLGRQENPVQSKKIKLSDTVLSSMITVYEAERRVRKISLKEFCKERNLNYQELLKIYRCHRQYQDNRSASS